MNKNINRLTASGLLIALAILIPQLFHLTGVPQSGQVFLPMHIPVLISGFVLGPVFGLIIGIFSPIISSIMTGMPAFARLPFMIFELATYGFVGGFLYNTLRLKRKKYGIYLSLVASMITGRAVYAFALTIAAYLFKIACGGPIAAINATVTGSIGIVIQLVVIPPMIFLLKKSGCLRDGDFMEQTVNILHTGEYTIVVQKEEQQYTSTKRGIAPILEIIDHDAKFLQDAIVADKVIGKAAALLLIYGKVKHIHADVISELAIDVLNQYKVSFTFKQKVPYIINRTQTDMCPMERCVLDINDPEHALLSLKEAVRKLTK